MSIELNFFDVKIMGCEYCVVCMFEECDVLFLVVDLVDNKMCEIVQCIKNIIVECVVVMVVLNIVYEYFFGLLEIIVEVVDIFDVKCRISDMGVWIDIVFVFQQ